MDKIGDSLGFIKITESVFIEIRNQTDLGVDNIKNIMKKFLKDNKNIGRGQKEIQQKFNEWLEKSKDISEDVDKITKKIAKMEFALFERPKGLKQVATDKLNLKKTGDKRFGVEPGFEAIKKWKGSDDIKLNNPTHKFYHEANKFIKNRLKFDPKFQEIAEKYKELIKDDINKENENELIDYLRNDDEIKNEVVIYLQKKFTKFHLKHYVKLDYSDPKVGESFFKKTINKIFRIKATETKIDPTRAEKLKVSIPYSRAKGPLGPIGKKIHQMGTAATRRDKNLGAVMEALSNDLFVALGFPSQNLQIRVDQYRDGTPKLLLDGTHVQGPLGEKFFTLDGQIKEGRIEDNKLIGEDGEKYPIDTADFARQMIKCLLMADRDKIGSKGANIGYVIDKITKMAKFYNIDPGKSLEAAPEISPEKRPRGLIKGAYYDVKLFLFGQTDRMAYRNVDNNFAFAQPTKTIRDRIQNEYKNYSIFEDTLLSEKMKGVVEIQENWDQVEFVFDQYIESFSKEGKLNFKEEIIAARDRLRERKNYFIEEVFKERLQLYSDFPERAPQLIDLLDNMEKLTSETFNHVKSVKLQHLGVVQQSRKEWHMVFNKETENLTLSFQGKNKQEAQDVLNTINQFIEEKSDTAFKEKLNRLKKITKDNKIEMTIPKDLIPQTLTLFNERKIAEYKKTSLP